MAQESMSGAVPSIAAKPASDDAPTIPAWRRYAVPAPPSDGRPTITLIIDDMGMGVSGRAIALPGPLTLSWLPFSSRLPGQIARAMAHGQEIMLHMPMEALGHTDPGPGTLRTRRPMEENRASLLAAFDAVPNAVGLNQHEASVASLSVPLMDMVAGELHARGMLFIDSVTIPRSVALSRAQAAGVPSAARDVFIDNEANPAYIRGQLAEAESIALRYGHVIAIGHPRPVTMDVLEKYLPALSERGFVLWPVSATVAEEMRIQSASRRSQ